jgi:hypothetical protein
MTIDDKLCETIGCANRVERYDHKERNVTVHIIYAHCKKCRKEHNAKTSSQS